MLSSFGIFTAVGSVVARAAINKSKSAAAQRKGTTYADCVPPTSWRTMRSIMMRRNRVLIRDVPALLIALGRLGPATFVVDVEPLVVPWDSAPTLFANAADDFAQAMRASVPSVASVIYSSNSRCPRAADGKSWIRVVTAARKPWRTRYLHDAPRPIAVVGNQVLTDGLLAWRLGASFLHWQVAGADTTMAPAPALVWPDCGTVSIQG